MLTTALELVGMALIVAAVLVAVGTPAALGVAGSFCLYVSWSLSRAAAKAER